MGLGSPLRTTALLGLALTLGAATARAEGEGARFAWHPSLRLTAVVDDNVFFEDGSKEGAVGLWMTPRVELDYQRSDLRAGADLGVDLRRYLDDASALQAELYRAVGWGELGLAPGLLLRVSDAYVPQAVHLGLPEDEAPNLIQSNRADAELRWWHGFAGERELQLGVIATHFLSEAYPEARPLAGGGFVLDPDFRADYVGGLAFAEFRTPLGERSSGYLRGQAGYRSFSEDSDADHSNLSLMLGWRSEPWERFEVELAGGVGALGFDAFGDALRALGRASLLYRFSSGLSVWLRASHLLTPDLIGEDVQQSTGEIGLEQRFGAATAASLRVFATRFDGDARGDEANLFGAAELRLRRQLTRRLQLAFSYRHWRNAGRLTLDDFSQNRMTLELGFRL